MATWLPEVKFAQVLDDYLSGSLELTLFSDPPSPDGSSTDGVEAVAARQPITLSAAADVAGARIMQKSSTNSQTFTGLLVASSEVNGWAIVSVATGGVLYVNDSWRPNRTFDAGDDFTVYAGELVVFGAYGP